MNARPDLAEPLSRDMNGFDVPPIDYGTPAVAGQLYIQTQGREVTARKVSVPRNLGKIMADLKVFCARFGDTYVYSWEVNDRKNQRKTTVEGGTIKLANDLVMLYGNCATDCDVQETATHWVFKAFFIDYEKGVTTSRLFQQRKGQETGMRDRDRQSDIVFQIGQSKALRNVVLNALSSFSNYAIEESKRALIDTLGDETNRNKAWGFIERVMTEHKIAMIRVEAVVGRKETDWTVRDLARVYQEMRGIHEGLTVADEVYPTEEDAKVVQADKEAKDTEGRKPAAKQKDDSQQGGQQPMNQQAAQTASALAEANELARNIAATKNNPNVVVQAKRTCCDSLDGQRHKPTCPRLADPGEATPPKQQEQVLAGGDLPSGLFGGA